MKQAIVKEMKKLGHYGRRIEDAYSVGFPDLVLIPRDYPVFFTEAKIVRDNLFGPTPRQFVELGRLSISKHAVCNIVGWKEGRHYIHKYVEQIDYRDCMAQLDDETFPQFLMRFYDERH